MMFSPLRPSIKQIITLADHRNISRAAAVLGMTQPQLTKTLQSVEHELGYQVFERTNRGLLITSRGKNFINHVRNLENFWQHTNQNVAEVAAVFKIGAHPLIAKTYVPRIVHVLRENFPLLNIFYIEKSSKEVSHLVASQELDIGIAADPVPLKGLIFREVSRDKVCIWSAGRDASTLVVNPQLILFSRFLKKSKYHHVLEIENYDVAATTAVQLGCHVLLPEPAAQSYPELRKVRVLSEIPIKVLFAERHRHALTIELIKNHLFRT